MNGYQFSVDPTMMQPERVHHWLAFHSHWAKGISFETVKKAMDHSFMAGAFFEGKQIAFARFITDYSIFAYLADVYVEEDHRGKGISKEMIKLLMAQTWVKDVRRFLLATKDAHSLYSRFGFGSLTYPERMMEIFHIDHYKQNGE